MLKTPEPITHKAFDVVDPDTIREQTFAYLRVYKKVGAVYRLSEMSDRNGNKVTVSFDDRGNITQMAGNNGGGSLSFQWSEGRNARLLAVTDQAGRRVSFDYDAQRQRGATDPSGQRWSYDYESGRLTRASDPLKRTLLRVRYDRSGRVAELGDGAGASLYDYTLYASGISQRTVVTNPLGARTTYEHNALGKLLSTSTDDGQAVSIEYNAANYPVRVSNPQNEEVRLEYDSQNRLVGKSGSDGSKLGIVYDEQDRIVSTVDGDVRTDYQFDERGNTVAARSTDPSGSYRATRSARGELLSIDAPDQSVFTFEYDAAGNTTAFNDPKNGRFETGYNAAGQITTRRLPSGVTVTLEYDASGRLVRKSDNKGHTLNVEREPSGAVTRLTAGNGNWVSATRDQAGRIIAVTSSNGKSRHYAYDARGALTDYTDAGGNTYKMQYDGRGRLREMKDGSGRKTTVERDAKGQTQHVYVTQPDSARYEYDASGNLLNVVRPSRNARFTPASYNLSASFAPAAAQWGGYGDPFGNLWYFDGFWGAGSAYGTFCDDGGLFDSFWGGGFSAWGFFDPFAGFGGFNGGWSDWDVSWDSAWHGSELGGYYDSGYDSSYDGGGGGNIQPYRTQNGTPDKSRPASQGRGGVTFTRASYSPALASTFYCAFGESCGDCVDRGRQNCDDSYATCRATALGATLAIAGSVALTGTVTVGVGAIVGGILLLGGEAAALYSCNRQDDTCRRNIRSNCPACQ